jgi:hypothetical protein
MDRPSSCACCSLRGRVSDENGAWPAAPAPNARSAHARSSRQRLATSRGLKSGVVREFLDRFVRRHDKAKSLMLP